jgi:hypothetical protein
MGVVDAWRAQGRPVVIAYGTNGGRLRVPGYRLEPWGEFVLDVPQWAFAYDFMPRSAWRVRLHYALYRAEPGEGERRYPFTIRFGRDDFPWLVRGFLEAVPEAGTRWIGQVVEGGAPRADTATVSGVVRFPALRKPDAVRLQLRARAPGAGTRLWVRGKDTNLAQVELSDQFADYEFVLDASALEQQGGQRRGRRRGDLRFGNVVSIIAPC